MRFHVDIDELAGGRPEGRVTEALSGSEAPFSGWVELLRLLEGHCSAQDGLAEADAGATTRRGSS